MQLIIFLEKTALTANPTAWYKSRIFPFVYALHFGTTFWVAAFWMFDVRHARCIQLWWI